MAREASPEKAIFLNEIQILISDKKNDEGMIEWSMVTDFTKEYNEKTGKNITNQSAENWIKSEYGDIITGKKKRGKKAAGEITATPKTPQEIVCGIIANLSNDQKIEALLQFGDVISAEISNVVKAMEDEEAFRKNQIEEAKNLAAKYKR